MMCVCVKKNEGTVGDGVDTVYAVLHKFKDKGPHSHFCFHSQ